MRISAVHHPMTDSDHILIANMLAQPSAGEANRVVRFADRKLAFDQLPPRSVARRQARSSP